MGLHSYLTYLNALWFCLVLSETNVFPVWGSAYRFHSSCISSPENHILLLCLWFPLSPCLCSFFLLPQAGIFYNTLPFYISTLYHLILSFCIFDVPYAYIWYTTFWCTVYFKWICPKMKNQYYSFWYFHPSLLSVSLSNFLHFTLFHILFLCSFFCCNMCYLVSSFETSQTNFKRLS